MLISSIVLFLSAWLGGMYAIHVAKTKESQVKSVLVFAGSFLFSITVIHILPELFESSDNHFNVGLWVLVGFFFQQLLEYFTNGVEHGHMHVHKHDGEHSAFTGISLMIALCTHSFLEGTILAHPSVMHGGHDESTLLAGIVLHKVPAALALMTVLACQYQKRTLQLTLLLIFSLASPLGVLVGHQIGTLSFMDSSNILLLFAFVAGNFLHISTTIFIESSPEHKLEFKKLIISILGAAAAVASEFLA